MIEPKYKAGDIVEGRTAVGQPVISMRIDKVVNQRGWIGNPTPSYIVTDLSNLFGISGYFVGEELIIETDKRRKYESENSNEDTQSQS